MDPVLELIKAINEALSGGVELDKLTKALSEKDKAGAAYGIFSTIKDLGHRDQAAKDKPKRDKAEADLKEALDRVKQLEDEVSSKAPESDEISKRDTKIATLENKLAKLDQDLKQRDVDAAVAKFEAAAHPGVHQAYRRVLSTDYRDRIRLDKAGKVEYLDKDGNVITADGDKSPLDILVAEAVEATPSEWRLTTKPDVGGGIEGQGGPGGLSGNRFEKAAQMGAELAKQQSGDNGRAEAFSKLIG